VVEIMFGDFMTLAVDQLINHAGKLRWMYNDQVQLPLVVRAPMGGRRGYGPTHSQSLEKLFLGAPGLTVLAPFHLAGGAGSPGDLLRWAILGQAGPVVFIENKVQYLLPLLDEPALADFEVRVIPDEGERSQAMSAGSAFTLSPCSYLLSIKSAPPAVLTLAAYGYMAELARQAQLKLAYEQEIFTELFVPTRLAPFNLGPALESAGRTRRLLVIEEGTRSLGWGAEVAAQAAETLGQGLLRVQRLAADDLPLPAAPLLEGAALPDVAGIIQKVKMMV
jgi:pyruvate/2-oxoglutarate/acetoin dehydrogenase E1 component